MGLVEKRVALVTGAGRGIGKAIAYRLAREGFIVAVNYNGSKDRAIEVAQAIQAEGGSAREYGCNVADFKASEEMIGQILQDFGRIDVLVNNAGITRDGLLMRMSEEDFDQVCNINLKGTFNCIRHVTRPMLKQKYGRIINISSVIGLSGNAGQANYAASKAGIIGLTKSVAKELGAKGITANAIAPGFIDTEMTKDLSESVKTAALAQIPLKTFGSSEDVAEAVAFFASEGSKYITGQVLAVDGGMAV